MIKLSKQTLDLLDDIERRIDPETEDDFAARWHDFLYDKFDGDVFDPTRKKLSPAGVEIPKVNINDAIEDYELMLLSQLKNVSDYLDLPGKNLVVRAHYGTGILSSVFGAEIFTVPRELNTLPTTRALGSDDKIEALIEAGIPDLNRGFGQRVFEFGEIVKEVFSHYPKINKYVEVFHPDVQGPLDICELLWGGDMFYAMYDDPDMVHNVLRVITDTYTAFLRKWYQIFPDNSEMNSHWGIFRHRGTIVVRDDSAMNLSPELYEEFAAPYDGELLQRFNGGAVHFCGRGDHYIEILSKLPGLTAINMSQPHLNDMEKIYQNTVDKGIKILGFRGDWAEKTIDRPGKFHHNMSSWPLPM